MSIALKPDVSTLQIVEVDVSTSQKMGKPSCMGAGRSAEQKFVTNCINGLSRKLKVMRQSGNPSKINVFYVAKIWCESTYFRYIFATLPFEFQLHPQNALLTSTLKSDTCHMELFPSACILLSLHHGAHIPGTRTIVTQN